MLTAALAFAGVAALINVTPGLDTLLVLRASVAGGRDRGIVSALGILCGCLVWGVAAAAGVTALLMASHLTYDALRVAGAAYLAWLGGSTLWQSRRGASASDEPEIMVPAATSRIAAFRAGVSTNLLNPKAGIFYMSLIPQFLPHGAPVASTTLLFTGIDLIELVMWYWVVSRAAAALSERIKRPAFRRRMEQVSGVVFLGFAANLLAERA